jgi:hypothetical protein
VFAKDGNWPDAFKGRALPRSPLMCLAAASGFLALSLGVFLFARRTAGALSSSPPVETVVLTALILISWSWLVRISFWRRQPGQCRSLGTKLRSPPSIVTVWIPLIAIALFAVACSYPFARTVDYAIWSLALVAVVWGPRFASPARRSWPAENREPDSDSVLQQLTRYRLSDGREAVRGILRAELAAGERSTTLYVAFCPPFERLPVVETFVVSGPTATLKLAQVLHQGAQIEVRRSGSLDCQQSVIVELSAIEPLVTESVNRADASSPHEGL